MSFACVAEALAPTYMRKGIAPGTTQRIRNAISRFVIIPYDADVVERWAQMAAILEGRLKGRGINDMWTAACALSYGLPVVTNNLSDFQTIQGEFPDLGLVHPDL
jgi:predicted nucleic acid-binding protein